MSYTSYTYQIYCISKTTLVSLPLEKILYIKLKHLWDVLNMYRILLLTGLSLHKMERVLYKEQTGSDDIRDVGTGMARYEDRRRLNMYGEKKSAAGEEVRRKCT